MLVLAVALALLIGLSLGILGGGGSILTVPIFVYVAGYGPKEAIAMSLAVVGATSLVGVIRHWREGNVVPRVALTFGVFAMVGAYAGARLAIYIPGQVQLAVFALIMLVVGARMIRSAAGIGVESSKPARRRLVAFQGVGVGALTGIVGVGGGFLIVPSLVLLARLPMKKAIGSSLLVIVMNTASGFVGYLGQAEIDWLFMSAFAMVGIVGILIGTHLVRFITGAQLKKAFGVFVLVMGVLILLENLAHYV